MVAAILIHHIEHAIDNRRWGSIKGVFNNHLAIVHVKDGPLLAAHELHGQIFGFILVGGVTTATCG